MIPQKVITIDFKSVSEKQNPPAPKIPITISKILSRNSNLSTKRYFPENKFCVVQIQ